MPTTAPDLTTNSAIAGATSTSNLLTRLAPIVRQDATALPKLIDTLSQLDPTMVVPVRTKALVWSKTPLGTVIGLGVGWAAAHYGMMCTAATVAAADCWTQGTVDLVSGIGAIVGTAIGSYVMRNFSPAPIGGVLSAAPK